LTIAAAYLVSEGVVLGADSTTSILLPADKGSGVNQLLNHTQKVFEVGENSNFGVCTWGAGSIGEVSHRTIIAQLADKIREIKDITVEKAANELLNLSFDLLKKTGTDFVGYYLGGCDPITHMPGCYKIEINQKNGTKEAFPIGQCVFSGMPNFFTRVFYGFDPGLPLNLVKEIKSLSKDDKFNIKLDEIFDTAFKNAYAPLIAEGYKDLPIREAIDFVYSYLHLTIKAMKFMFGAPGCGGPIEIGFITTDRKFRWAVHKSFTTAMHEQEGGNYVG